MNLYTVFLSAYDKAMQMSLFIALLLLVSPLALAGGDHGHHQVTEAVPKGPNGGRLLEQADLSLELVLFELGVPAEFRIYPRFKHHLVNPEDVIVAMKLTRLGDVVEPIHFTAKDAYLRGDITIYEPHSFIVEVSALYQGQAYEWQYDNVEGRTHIDKKMAEKMAIKTAQVIPQTLSEQITVYGELTQAANAQRHILAPYSGLITQLNVELGQRVKKAQVLMTIKSNESLQSYQIKAPIAGLITAQNIAEGEQTHIQSNDESLLTITDTSRLVAEVTVFAKDQHKVKLGQKVVLNIQGSTVEAQLAQAVWGLTQTQGKVYRAFVDNREGVFMSNQFVKAQIEVAEFQVAKAVRVEALQSFRDFTVVYTKIGNDYEVRMLELGRRTPKWAEVLSGIELGAEYVTENSYLLKADIEKAGAAHDH